MQSNLINKVILYTALEGIYTFIAAALTGQWPLTVVVFNFIHIKIPENAF